MATERLKEVRDWIGFGATLLSVLIIPVFLLFMKTQRLEMREETRQGYVSLEVYHADIARRDSDIARRDAEWAILSAKIDRLTISVARLTDAVKLKDPP